MFDILFNKIMLQNLNQVLSKLLMCLQIYFVSLYFQAYIKIRKSEEIFFPVFYKQESTQIIGCIFTKCTQPSMYHKEVNTQPSNGIGNPASCCSPHCPRVQCSLFGTSYGWDGTILLIFE